MASRFAFRELHNRYLVIHNVIVRFIHAFVILRTFQIVQHILFGMFFGCEIIRKEIAIFGRVNRLRLINTILQRTIRTIFRAIFRRVFSCEMRHKCYHVAQVRTLPIFWFSYYFLSTSISKNLAVFPSNCTLNSFFSMLNSAVTFFGYTNVAVLAFSTGMVISVASPKFHTAK